MTSASTVDTWTYQWTTVTCGPDTTKVQAVMSLNTPDADGGDAADGGQRTGNVYYDSISFGVYAD